MKAIIPAAGLGTRFLPVTKSQPKEMLPVVDKPVIQYVVEEAVAAEADDILIITGRGKRAIEDHFDRSIELEDLLESAGDTNRLRSVRAISDLAEVFYVRQKRPRGLGHAVGCGAPFTGDEPFFVLLGDVLVPHNTHPAAACRGARAVRRVGHRRHAGARRARLALRGDRRPRGR